MEQILHAARQQRSLGCLPRRGEFTSPLSRHLFSGKVGGGGARWEHEVSRKRCWSVCQWPCAGSRNRVIPRFSQLSQQRGNPSISPVLEPNGKVQHAKAALLSTTYSVDSLSRRLFLNVMVENITGQPFFSGGGDELANKRVRELLQGRK